jgi:hypothetical protein
MREARIIVASLIAVFAALTANAQSSSVSPTHLALEVYSNPGNPPSYIPVPPAGNSASLTWFSRFKRVPGRTDLENPRLVKAVIVRAINTGDRVAVSVSVFLGENKFEEERNVAVYNLQEREKVTVRQLLNFDVEPFDVTLVRVENGPNDLPQVISKAGSVVLLTVQERLSTLPGYRVTLRNLSPKNVVALMIKVRQGNRLLSTGMPQGKEGLPLIPGNDTAEIVVPAATRVFGTPGAYQPVAESNQTIEITTAAFEDGSSEGEPSYASKYRELVAKRKIELAKIIELFQEALGNDLSDPSTAIRVFEGKMAVIDEVGGVRTHVMSEIHRFRLNTPDLDANTYRAWLKGSKEKYEAWLARL